MPTPKPSAEVIRHALQHIVLTAELHGCGKPVWTEVEKIVAETEKLEWQQMTPSQRRKAFDFGWFKHLAGAQTSERSEPNGLKK